MEAGVNVLLVGPAGTGKTTLAHHVAQDLGREFGAIHCSAGMSESHLLGYLLPLGDNGQFTFTPATFARLYGTDNSLFLMDELDAADANTLLVMNGALANGALHIPQNPLAPSIQRGKNSSTMAAANTFGSGGDYTYAGRAPLDAATTDRYYAVYVDYDARVEARMAGAAMPKVKTWKAHKLDAATVQAECERYLAWVTAVRAAVTKLGLHRVVSTRWVQKGVAAMRAGITPADVRVDMLASWTNDERARVDATISHEVK